MLKDYRTIHIYAVQTSGVNIRPPIIHSALLSLDNLHFG